MRRRTPDLRGWSQPARRGPRKPLLLFVLATTLLGGTFITTPVAPASADSLSDAIARQKALEVQIAKQKAGIANLEKKQRDLTAALASTKASLAQVNADLTAVRSQVVQATVAVANAAAAVQSLDTQVIQLDLQLGDLQASEARKRSELKAQKAALAERIRQAYEDRKSVV